MDTWRSRLASHLPLFQRHGLLRNKIQNLWDSLRPAAVRLYNRIDDAFDEYHFHDELSAATIHDHHEFWRLNFVKLFVIWALEFWCGWVVLTTRLEDAVLWHGPGRDWNTMTIITRAMVYAVWTVILIDVGYYHFTIHWTISPRYFFWSCVIRNLLVLTAIVALVVGHIRIRRSDPGMGWMIFNACLVEGYFLAATVFAYMCWATEVWEKKLDLMTRLDRRIR